MTNNHVVEGAESINLKFNNGNSYKARLIGGDPDTDVAVVQVEDQNFKRKDLSELILGNSDEAKVGSIVVAAGAPFNLQASVSCGIISAKERGGLQIANLGDFIQTDAAINPGNSGGPLMDLNGRVVGVNTAILSKSGGNNGAGLALPAKLARRTAQRIIRGVPLSRGYIGVVFQPMTKEIANFLGINPATEGMIVSEVAADSPAEKAGIQSKDVITRVDNRAITSDRDLVSLIGLKDPNTKVMLEIIRNKKKMRLPVVVGLSPTYKQNDPHRSMPAIKRPDLGITVEWTKKGLIVQEIMDKSPAQRKLQKNDIIMIVGKQSLDPKDGKRKTMRLFKAAIKQARDNNEPSIIIQVKRNQGILLYSISLKP